MHRIGISSGLCSLKVGLPLWPPLPTQLEIIRGNGMQRTTLTFTVTTLLTFLSVWYVDHHFQEGHGSIVTNIINCVSQFCHRATRNVPPMGMEVDFMHS